MYIIGFIYDVLVMEVCEGYEMEVVKVFVYCMEMLFLKEMFGIEVLLLIIFEVEIGDIFVDFEEIDFIGEKLFWWNDNEWEVEYNFFYICEIKQLEIVQYF